MCKQIEESTIFHDEDSSEDYFEEILNFAIRLPDIEKINLFDSVTTLNEIAQKSPTKWEGSLALKKSLYPVKFHLTDGNDEIVESFLQNTNQPRITRRLPLDLQKLEEVKHKIDYADSMGIFLGLSGPPLIRSDDTNIQSRSFSYLVSYLKRKNSAGVTGLINAEAGGTGVIYVFPPCEFSKELLKRTCIDVSNESLQEDHLVIVVIRWPNFQFFLE